MWKLSILHSCQVDVVSLDSLDFWTLSALKSSKIASCIGSFAIRTLGSSIDLRWNDMEWREGVSKSPMILG